MSELTLKTICELRDGFREGEFTAREIAEDYVAAVASAKLLNAYTVETPEDALAAADAADKARGSSELGSLAGIPLGIKDLFATKGVDTTAGSRILEGFKPPYESSVSANLRKAGAGMLGKLNMDEFAMGSSNETSAYGPVISPWRRKGSNVALTPGGSSGGSAAAVAAGYRSWSNRHRYRRLDPPAGGVRRDLRDQANLRSLLALGDRRLCKLARPGRPNGENGPRLRHPPRGDVRVRSKRFDLARPTRSSVGSELIERSQRQARRYSQGVSDRGSGR